MRTARPVQRVLRLPKTSIPKQNFTDRVTPNERSVSRKWQRVILPVDKLSQPTDAAASGSTVAVDPLYSV